LCNGVGFRVTISASQIQDPEELMTDFRSVLNTLRRPKILIRAARSGVKEYRRDRDLKRLLRDACPGAPRQAILTLLAEENRLETNRKTGAGTYSIQRHVAVLTAIIAEARLVPAPARYA
jgi:hypothetical protein